MEGGGAAKLRIARVAFNLLTVTFGDLLQNVCGEMYVSLDGLLKCSYTVFQDSVFYSNF